MKQNRFIIVSPGYNGVDFIPSWKACIENQSYKNYKVIFIDDASTDNTKEVASNMLSGWKPLAKAIYREENKGILYNKTIPLLEWGEMEDDDIVVILDEDDLFHNDFVLEYLNNVYQDEAIWFTYGTLMGTNSGVMRHFCQPIPQNASIRKLPWITSQLKTVKWFVYKNVLKKDLMDMNGEWFKACSDLSMFWPIIEMIGPRHIKFIPHVTYIYREATGKNVHLTNREYQLACDKFLRGKKEYTRKLEHELSEHECDWK